MDRKPVKLFERLSDGQTGQTNGFSCFLSKLSDETSCGHHIFKVLLSEVVSVYRVDQSLYFEGDSGKDGLNSNIIRMSRDSHPSYLYLRVGNFHLAALSERFSSRQ